MASLTFPREISRENGIMKFQISAEHYLKAGAFMDMMKKDQDICRTGGFVARLEDTVLREEHIAHNVDSVKDVIRRDALDPDTGRPFFDPTLQERGYCRAEKGVFKLRPCSEKETDGKYARKLRKVFKRDVIKHNFMQSSGYVMTYLEELLQCSGINGLLDSLFKVLIQKNSKIMYATNISLDGYLDTTECISMAEMESLLQFLPGEPSPGLTHPAVYIGQEATCFNIHIEDYAFEAVNRHIAGSPKVWFLVPPRFYDAFGRMVTKMGVHPIERNCRSLVNHNSMFLDPRTVVQYGIPVFTVVQQPRDIVYLLPFTIHWGFNLGINLNEGTNIASSSWAEAGMLAPQRCFRASAPEDSSDDFDISPLLRKAGISEETVSDYESGWLRDGLDSSSILHPENGLPGSTALAMENVLGPDFQDVEIGKRYNVQPHLKGVKHDAAIWGGFKDVIDISDSDEDEGKEEAGGSRSETEQDMIKYKCTAPCCTYRASGRGSTALNRLHKHIERFHGPQATKVKEEVQDRLKKAAPETGFTCEFCSKVLSGNKFHKTRHAHSCRKKPAE